MKSSKGQVTQVFSLMVGLTIIILALALAPAISDNTARSRNATDGDLIGMDCSNSSISDFTKAACIATDISPFWLVATLILIGGAYISFKVVSQ